MCGFPRTSEVHWISLQILANNGEGNVEVYMYKVIAAISRL